MSTSHDRIARRAYQIFQARGEQHGQDWADWFQAERDIRVTETAERLTSTQLSADSSVDALLKRIPSSLYRYSGLGGERLEWMRRLVVDFELYFAAPSLFNDPLDFKIATSFEAIGDVIEKHWRDLAEKSFASMPAEEKEARIQRLIRDSATADGRKRLEDKLLGVLAGNGTACFATDPTNMLMWSYYADGHKGAAVRFGMDLDRILALGTAFNEQGTDLFPVEVGGLETRGRVADRFAGSVRLLFEDSTADDHRCDSGYAGRDEGGGGYSRMAG